MTVGKKRGAPDEQKPPRVKPQRITDEEPPEVTFNSYVDEIDLSTYMRDVLKMSPEQAAAYESAMNAGWADLIFGGEPGRAFEGLEPRYYGTRTGRFRSRHEPTFGRERDMDPRERAYRESRQTGEEVGEVYERIVDENKRIAKVKELRMRFGDETVLTQLVRILEEMGDMESILMVLEPDVIQARRADDGREVHHVDYSATERRMMRDTKF
jgi:hypothetical protein